jgi:4'-phosphopantetheinyl transferase
MSDLFPGVVEVWAARPQEVSLEYSILSQDEQRRADRFADSADRERYRAARTWLRCTLSKYAQIPPQRIEFSYGPFGKPMLAFPKGPIQFSLTHSGHLALVAVSSGEPVGADVEEIPGRTLGPAESSLVLSPVELDFIQRSTDPDRAFLTCWTRKEAFAKVDGRGLERDLKDLTLTDREGLSQKANGYRLVDLPVPGAIAAVAVSTRSEVVIR